MPPPPAAAAAAAALASPGPAVRLYSLGAAPPSARVVHLIRHAEGYHNVAAASSDPSHAASVRGPALLDARLTPRGWEQCAALARHTPALEVGCVVSSSLTRCLQTAVGCFPHLLGEERDRDGDGDGEAVAVAVPFVAREEWRETCNYLCDSRRPTGELREEFPLAEFGPADDADGDADADGDGGPHAAADPLWARYVARYGPPDSHPGQRESADGPGLEARSRRAWEYLLDRPERSLALVAHSAFFMHNFQPYLDEMTGVVSYEDGGVRDLLGTSRFENCELRSVAFDAP